MIFLRVKKMNKENALEVWEASGNHGTTFIGKYFTVNAQLFISEVYFCGLWKITGAYYSKKTRQATDVRLPPRPFVNRLPAQIPARLLAILGQGVLLPGLFDRLLDGRHYLIPHRLDAVGRSDIVEIRAILAGRSVRSPPGKIRKCRL